MDLLTTPFFERAAREPDRLACLSATHSQTAGEIADHALQAVERLNALDLPSGSIVALLAPNGPAFLSSYAALRMSGLVVLLIDATTPEEEQLRIAERLGAALIWRHTEAWNESPAEVIALAGGGRAPEGTAALKLTSGSTGEPAGVAVSDRALVADATALATSMGFRGTDRFLVAIPMSHSYGFSVLTSPAYQLGATLILPDGANSLAIARDLEATVFPSVPNWFSSITEVAGLDEWPASLRLLISAGAPLTAETASRFRDRFGASIHAFYGSSECGGIAYDQRGDAADRGSVGTLIAGVSIDLLEPDGDSGTVSVNSEAVALGYVPEPDGSRSRLRDGRFTTEDLAKFEGEELFLIGRKSEWINVKGKKVNPREVESVLMQLDGVREVVVLAQPVAGRVGQIVRAVIAGCPTKHGYRKILEWCRPRLASHKIPRSVIIVESIPRNGRGKVNRPALLALTPGD